MFEWAGRGRIGVYEHCRQGAEAWPVEWHFANNEPILPRCKGFSVWHSTPRQLISVLAKRCFWRRGNGRPSPTYPPPLFPAASHRGLTRCKQPFLAVHRSDQSIGIVLPLTWRAALTPSASLHLPPPSTLYFPAWCPAFYVTSTRCSLYLLVTLVALLSCLEDSVDMPSVPLTV